MLDRIIDLDKQLIVFFNHLGSPFMDSFWLLVTKPVFWTPFFLFVLYQIRKKIGNQNTLILLLFVAFLILITDQTSNIFKKGFQRLRPCNDPSINYLLHIVKASKSFSFFSGHAANSMAVSVFIFSLMRKNSSYWLFIFVWPLFFAYSRMYLGLHYPTDILSGYTCGLIYGLMVTFFYKKVVKKYTKSTL
jgi:undecaprenyl-diphosphatase